MVHEAMSECILDDGKLFYFDGKVYKYFDKILYVKGIFSWREVNPNSVSICEIEADVFCEADEMYDLYVSYM